MNKNILYRIGQEHQHRIRIGEVGFIINACYHNAKSKGYENNHIYFEWPMKVAFDMRYRLGVFFPCPKHTILPVIFKERKDVKLSDYDEVIDFCKENSLYDGFVPYYSGDESAFEYQVISTIGFTNYLNKYFYDTGNRPEIHIESDKLEKQYVLFHLRYVDWKQERNPDLNVYHSIVKMIKERYKDKYEYVKIGEPCRGIDRMFDKTFSYFDDFNDFLKIINNCLFFVCCESGPDTYGEMFGKPNLHIEAINSINGFRTKEFWQRHKNVIGETGWDWMDKNKIKVMYKGDTINTDDIVSFTDRWL